MNSIILRVNIPVKIFNISLVYFSIHKKYKNPVDVLLESTQVCNFRTKEG